MTIEEKLEHFTTITVENALKASADTLSEYRENMSKRFLEHKEHMAAVAKNEEAVAIESIKRNSSRAYTTEQLHIRRKNSHKQDELKTKLFAEVMDLLDKYKLTEEYPKQMVCYAKRAKQMAGKDKIVMYIDSSDAALKDIIEKEAKCEVNISDIKLGGGLKAEIPARNMLIDNSFAAKISSIREKYVISAD